MNENINKIKQLFDEILNKYYKAQETLTINNSIDKDEDLSNLDMEISYYKICLKESLKELKEDY